MPDSVKANMTAKYAVEMNGIQVMKALQHRAEKRFEDQDENI